MVIYIIIAVTPLYLGSRYTFASSQNANLKSYLRIQIIYIRKFCECYFLTFLFIEIGNVSFIFRRENISSHFVYMHCACVIQSALHETTRNCWVLWLCKATTCHENNRMGIGYHRHTWWLYGTFRSVWRQNDWGSVTFDTRGDCSALNISFAQYRSCSEQGIPLLNDVMPQLPVLSKIFFFQKIQTSRKRKQ